MRLSWLRVIVFGLLSGLVIGCGQHRAPSPARINHIVFVSLQDPDDYKDLLIDSDALLSTIPSVKTYSAGPHYGTGRDTIISDYDLAIILGFDTREQLAAYVAHPQHIDYVTKWKPKLSSLRVYDMLDQSDAPIRPNDPRIGSR